MLRKHNPVGKAQGRAPAFASGFSFFTQKSDQVTKATKCIGYSQDVGLRWDIGDVFQHQMHASDRRPKAQAAARTGAGDAGQEEKKQKAWESCRPDQHGVCWRAGSPVQNCRELTKVSQPRVPSS